MNKNLNLLFFIDRYPGYGGIESVTSILSNLFVNSGYLVTIVSFKQENLELLTQLDKRVNLLSLPNKELLSNENKLFLISEITKKNIDIIIHQHSYAPIFELIVEIKNLIECRIVTFEHNTPDAQIKMYSNYLKENNFNFNWKFNLEKLLYPVSVAKCRMKERKRHRFLLKYSDYYILLSELFVKNFEDITGIKNSKKIVSIPNPLPETNDFKVLNKQKIILYVGRLDKNQKRVDRLIRIFEKLYINFPDWYLYIIGDGAYREEIEEYVKNKKIDRVIFEGFQLDVSSYYIKASIICLTSNVEGWGLVLSEAMQYGVIPFSFDSFVSVHDLIKNEKTGFIIPSFNEDEYVRKLSCLMNDPENRLQIAKNATLSSQRFNGNKVLLHWQKLILNET